MALIFVNSDLQHSTHLWLQAKKIKLRLEATENENMEQVKTEL